MCEATSSVVSIPDCSANCPKRITDSIGSRASSNGSPGLVRQARRRNPVSLAGSRCASCLPPFDAASGAPFGLWCGPVCSVIMWRSCSDVVAPGDPLGALLVFMRRHDLVPADAGWDAAAALLSVVNKPSPLVRSGSNESRSQTRWWFGEPFLEECRARP